MNRTLRTLTLSTAIVVALTPGLGWGKKKPKAPPKEDSGGSMTFEPETVERKDADSPPPPPTRSEPVAKPARKVRAADPNAKSGPASKVLERALNFYDHEDYATAT